MADNIYKQKQGLEVSNPLTVIGVNNNNSSQNPKIMTQELKQDDVTMEDTEKVKNQDALTFSMKFDGAPRSKPIPNSIKKKRTNYRLRKVIVPKAPLMVLNEMVGSVNYSFLNTPPIPNNIGNMQPMQLFTAQCVVYGDTFTGTGPSKQIAKNICAEHAIQAVVVKKSKEAKEKQQTDAEGNPLKPNQMEDETPWAQLASLALFKLFNDWQAQGKTVPSDLWKVPDGKDKDDSMEDPRWNDLVGMAKTQKPAKKIPDNPTDRHPVQLLNELRGGVMFNLVSEVGTSPSITFTIGVEIDGKTFIGEGKTKKEAKKNCAIEVLKQCHGIVFSNLKTE